MRTLALFLSLSIGVSANDHWPQWRGPSLNGTSDSTGLPLKWSDTDNVAWKAKLPSWSGATPAIDREGNPSATFAPTIAAAHRTSVEKFRGNSQYAIARKAATATTTTSARQDCTTRALTTTRLTRLSSDFASPSAMKRMTPEVRPRSSMNERPATAVSTAHSP